MRAPAVLAGTILLAALFTVPAAAAAREALWLHAGSVWSLWLLGYGPLVVGAWDYAGAPWAGTGELLRGLVFWSLVSGGVLDRYAQEHKEPLSAGKVPDHCEIVGGEFWTGEIARHDRLRLAYALWSVLSRRLLEES